MMEELGSLVEEGETVERVSAEMMDSWRFRAEVLGFSTVSMYMVTMVAELETALCLFASITYCPSMLGAVGLIGK